MQVPIHEVHHTKEASKETTKNRKIPYPNRKENKHSRSCRRFFENSSPDPHHMRDEPDYCVKQSNTHSKKKANREHSLLHLQSVTQLRNTGAKLMEFNLKPNYVQKTPREHKRHKKKQLHQLHRRPWNKRDFRD